jgi:arginine decarboxylase
MADVPSGYKGIVIAPPLPYEFFVTSGIGQSKHQIHAGSYHDAMRAAGVELGNLIPYTSILPRIAKEIPLEEGVQRIEHGAEVKVIQAAAHVDLESKLKRATSGILFAWLHPKGKRGRIGGLVCEYNGNGTVDEARENLESCMDGLYRGPNRSGKTFAESHDLKGRRFISATIEPKERYGTALTALAFVSYVIPVLDQNVFEKDELAEAFAQSSLGGKGITSAPSKA